ncbi:phage major capsid protein [Methylovirgula ligni]|uniref:HK97 family phage major capsid protein n=1 Tax=Methylovirgula ligni TaxID=569860 RepID=A0A3D9YL00_9HYPH|nr:phage major capsid protein [Methylovirgula ligni]QAY96702.1 phage major capsid protein [Methylovirgula ligni]REF83257.1 HK97 family phage major capsid protein [Methylovirgula ligni]
MTEKSVARQLGEWALALLRAEQGLGVDAILNRAPTGAGETVATAGGFLVPTAAADFILGTIYEDRNSVLPYFFKWNIPDGANSTKVPGADETSRANGYRWGGVVADFEDEGDTQVESLPRLKQTEFSANKIIGFAVVTDELLADAENLGNFLQRAFSDELRYKLEQYSLSAAGTGAGKPLGILNSPALVSVAKQSGQSAGTIVGANLEAMWTALPAASRKRAIWAVSETAAAQADGATTLGIYPFSGSTNPDDVPRIKGRPAIETDALPIVGTPGDILLIDPAWYAVASKPIDWAMSADVLFISDQTVFRITWRVDARPLVSAQITGSDGSARSPFVALAARS